MNDDERASEQDDDSDAESITNLAPVAILFGLVVAFFAWGVGWLVEVPPEAIVHWRWQDAAWGSVAALVPLALFFGVVRWIPWGPLDDVNELTREFIGPMFRDSTVVQLALVAAAAGIGEEMLFRGVIQHGLTLRIEPPLGMIVGFAVSALLFGLAHWLTWMYAVLTALMAVYFGWLMVATDNLLTPIVAHGVYDLFALLIIRHDAAGATPAPPGNDPPLAT